MKKYATTLMIGLTILYAVPLCSMIESPLVQASTESQNKCCSKCPNKLLRSIVTGGIASAVIIGSAVHIGKKIDEISRPIGQIDGDAFNDALHMLGRINATSFNSAMDMIGQLNATTFNGAAETIEVVNATNLNEAIDYVIILGKIGGLIRECPAALPHIRAIWQDCFVNPEQNNALASLTIEL